MLFEASDSMLYSDTLLPDVFVTEYMPSMDGDFVKVYIHCLFLSKFKKQASAEELSKKLEIVVGKVKDALIYLENVGIITRKDDKITFIDLKGKEIKKIYRMKAASSPDEAILSSERNKKRNSVITAINKSFFQGLMSPSWYTDIDTWFDRYKFDEDVMMNLFSHCYNHKGLSKQYIAKVADNWHSKNIKSHFEVEKYLDEYNKFKDIRSTIVKKLKLARNLTEYEEQYIEKWVMEYLYNFDIIEIALKKTTGKTNPNFKYLHTIISDWYEKGLRSKDEIAAFDKSKKQPGKQTKDFTIPQHTNYKQREYDDDYYNNLYENVRK